MVGIQVVPIGLPYEEVAARIAVALAAGLVVGLEREWAQKEIGVRTFSIVALLGALSSLLSSSLLIASLGGVLLMVGFLNVHSLLKDRSLELTTSAALIVVLVLGALAGQGHYFTTSTSAIVITMLLAWKAELSRFAGALHPEEIRGAVLLALLSFVIYPLLPDRFVDPWQLINPRQAWVIVVVIAGIGFANYVLLRLYGTRGMYYGAFLGGLVNSTAAAAELSGAVGGTTGLASRAIAILLLTNVAMFLRNAVILAIFAPVAVVTAFLPLAVMAAVAVVLALARSRQNQAEGGVEQVRLASPVSLVRVLKFAVLFLVIASAETLAQRFSGNTGFLVISILGGLVSSASTTASAAALVMAGRLSPSTAGAATVLASMASCLVNLPLVYVETRQLLLTRRLAIASIVLVAVGLILLFAQTLFLGPVL